MTFEQEPTGNNFERALMDRTQGVIRRMRERPFQSGSDPAVLEKRKDQIEHVLAKIGEQAPALLDTFESCVKKHLGSEWSFKEVALFVVGGNAHGGEFKETSDVDLVFAADPPLAKDAAISYAQRNAIAKELYAAIEKMFETDAARGQFAEGDIELKGFGNQTPSELRDRETKEKDVIRLLSKVWAT